MKIDGQHNIIKSTGDVYDLQPICTNMYQYDGLINKTSGNHAGVMPGTFNDQGFGKHVVH